MDLSIIIVNFDSAEYVRACIESIYRNIRNISFEIIVVDNNSSNKSILGIQSIYSSTILLMLEKNEGFGSGNNKGAEIATGDYLFFLNPDTYLVNNSIEKMLAFAIENNSGITCPVVYNPDRTIQYFHNKFHSVWYFVSEAFNFYHKSIKNVIESDKSVVNGEPFRIDWALGAAIMIKNELFRNIGGFDKRYFMYYEDADICKRVNDIGLQNFCFAKAGIVHVLSVTSRNKSFSKFHVHRSRLIYMMKFNSLPENLLLRTVFMSSIILRMLVVPFQSGVSLRNRLAENMRNLKLYFHSKNYILNSPEY